MVTIPRKLERRQLIEIIFALILVTLSILVTYLWIHDNIVSSLEEKLDTSNRKLELAKDDLKTLSAKLKEKELKEYKDTDDTKNLIPNFADEDNTVSFAQDSYNIYLKYKGKFFSASDYQDPLSVELPARSELTFKGLVQAPTETRIFDELLSFKVAPQKKKFVFVMRWSDNQVFYYPGTTPKQVKKILSFKETPNTYNVPKIYSFSQDEKYIAFNMYRCWGCDGHQPEKLLYRISDGKTQRIGQTSYFKWRDGGNYDYKEYKTVDCEASFQCPVDPETLPPKTARFQ